ncbi:hypothetical protein DNHGIG_36880 [Collibacillus ludicampi]|uniref:Uncharacterized protein n=1 Tax=Collibacillus ludicampi TaxID=2771369 RepID=A0AAV4LK18_9BACL|nr:hypothetical protein DNHGIG_36880 [Collibacillus ludicampi]
MKCERLRKKKVLDHYGNIDEWLDACISEIGRLHEIDEERGIGIICVSHMSKTT